MKDLKTSIFTALIIFCCFLNTNAQDTDNDGIPDSFDNCRFTYNPTQQDIDTDQFGTGIYFIGFYSTQNGLIKSHKFFNN